eukprot:jgi/Tetstr1/459803/TSEL_005154.t1
MAARRAAASLASWAGGPHSWRPPKRLPARSGRWMSVFAAAEPPVATAKPQTRERYGLSWTDEYAWMEDSFSGRVRRHLAQEERYADAILQGLQPLISELRSEMQARVRSSQESLPERLGSWEYLCREEAGSPMPTYLRRPCGGGPAQAILDQAELEERHGRGAIGALKISQCQNLLAYSVDAGGDERYSCWVKDLRTPNSAVVDSIESVGSFEWLPDSSGLLYTEPDSQGRPARAMLHRLGAAAADDACLLREEDDAAYMEVGKTKDWAYNLVNINSKAFSEVHLLPASAAALPSSASLRCVSPRQPGHQYFVEHSHGRLVILSSHGGQDFQLVTMRPDCLPAVGPSSWEPLPGCGEAGLVIEDMDVFRSCVVLHMRASGRPKVGVLPTAAMTRGQPRTPGGSGQEPHLLPIPAWATCVEPGVNPDPGADELLLCLSSPVVPPHWVAFSLTDPEAPPKLLRVEHLATESSNDAPPQIVEATRRVSEQTAGNTTTVIEGTALTCERRTVRSHDGLVDIPVTISHREDLPLDGSAPMLVCMYGAYGISLEADFCPYRLSLLTRGWVVALAHCRGGGEMGRAWHQGAIKLKKPNSVLDAEAVIDSLISCGYSSNGQVALHGFSAGGLLLGGLLNRRPDTFAAAVAHAPYVDMLTACTDPSLPLTVHEYDEWGMPEDDAAVASMCPYHNSAAPGGAGRLPALLVTASLDDAARALLGPRQVGGAPAAAGA